MTQKSYKVLSTIQIQQQNIMSSESAKNKAFEQSTFTPTALKGTTGTTLTTAAEGAKAHAKAATSLAGESLSQAAKDAQIKATDTGSKMKEGVSDIVYGTKVKGGEMAQEAKATGHDLSQATKEKTSDLSQLLLILLVSPSTFFLIL